MKGHRRNYPTEYFIREEAIFTYLKSSHLVDFGEIEYFMLNPTTFSPLEQKINKNPYFKQIMKLSKTLIDLSLAYIPFDELYIQNPFDLILNASDMRLIELLIANKFLNITPEVREIKDLIEENNYHKLSKAELSELQKQRQGPFRENIFSEFF